MVARTEPASVTVLAPFANVQFEQLCTSTAFSKRSMWQAWEQMQLLHEFSWKPKHCTGSTERRCHCLPEPLARPDPGENSSCYDIYAHLTSCTICYQKWFKQDTKLQWRQGPQNCQGTTAVLQPLSLHSIILSRRCFRLLKAAGNPSLLEAIVPKLDEPNGAQTQ